MSKNFGNEIRNWLQAVIESLPEWTRKLLIRIEARFRTTVFGSDQPRFWGGMPLPSRFSDPSNYLITGTIGSGKTMHLLLWLKAVLAGIKPGSDQRLIAFDPKNTVIRHIHAMGIQVPMKVLLPSDLRCSRLDFQSMCTSIADADQFAAALVPPNPNEKSPFYTNACRSLVAGTIQSLILTGVKKWDLRDVILILEDEAYTKLVIGRCDQTRSKLRFLKKPDSELWMNLSATIEEKLGQFRILAAFWSRAQDEISLDDFLETEQILILGKDQRIDVALGAAYQLLFRRLSELILALPEKKGRRIFLCLDEFPRLAGDASVPGFEDLLAEGRDRGLTVLCAFQHIQQIRRRYSGCDDSLMSYFRNLAFYAAGEESHAEWVSKQCGDERVREQEEQESVNRSFVLRRWDLGMTYLGKAAYENVLRNYLMNSASKSYSISVRTVDRRILPASEFLAMPLPSKEKGLTGVYRSPAIGLWTSTIPGDFIEKNLPKPSPTMPGYLRRPNSHQILEPFGQEDLDRLGLPRTPDPNAIRAIEELIDDDADV
jgi:hypothetical protein